MSSYVIVKATNAHLNIAVSKDTKERMFLSAESVLYRCLNGNFDMMDNICKRANALQFETDVIKSVQQRGRAANSELRKECTRFFNNFGWEQEAFLCGFEWVKDTSFCDIDDEQKEWYLSIVEEAFYTTATKDMFYKLIRGAAEGSIVAKKHFVTIIQDIVYGIRFEETQQKCYGQ
jgi:hypothetical protein